MKRAAEEGSADEVVFKPNEDDMSQRQLQEIAEKVFVLGSMKSFTGFSTRRQVVDLMRGLNDNEVLEVSKLVATMVAKEKK
jgi:hypothetical protein